MGEKLTLPVPETLNGIYAVAAGAPVSDPVELARAGVTERLRPPLRDLALRMLDSPLLALDQRAAAEFPPLPTDLLATFKTSDDELAAIAGASHLLAVRTAYQPGWPPAHEWAARAVAGALGAALRAPVIDVFTPQVLSQERLWNSLPDAEGYTRLVDWMLIPHSQSNHGFWFTTKGLARFGLPELQAENVPTYLIEPFAQALNGLARRLLDLWLEEIRAGEQPIFVELPEIITVNLQDVGAAYGADEELRREVSVRLRLDVAAESDTFLTVLPPDERLGEEYYAAMCAGLFGELPIRADDELDRAIAAARATLDDARSRFLLRELGGGRLVVRHRPGFAWAYVTSWNDAARILGTATDGGGRVTIAADDVVDWGIWVDGQGLVDGGATDGLA